jgi:hypothetical protein
MSFRRQWVSSFHAVADGRLVTGREREQLLGCGTRAGSDFLR